MSKKSSVFYLSLLIFGLLLGCSRNDGKKAEQPKTFEEFAKTVAVAPSRTETARPEAEEERPLNIGLVAPETGEESEVGRMTVEGVGLAIDAFNTSGGVKGKPIRYIDIDTKGNSALTDQAIGKLINQRVIAIIGAPTGWTTFTPVYAANDSRTIFIVAGTRRHIGSSGPFVFKTGLPVERAAGELIDYAAAKEGFKRFFIVTVMEDESLNVAGAFRRAAFKKGVEIKAEGSVFTSSDLPEAARTLKKNMPVDSVIFAGSPAMAIGFLKEAKKNGITLPLLGGEELYNDEFLKGGTLVAGSLVYSGFSQDDTDPLTKGFVDSYSKKKGHAPSLFVAEAYDSFMLLARAIKDAGSTRPDAVREGMMNIKDFQGVTGTISFDAEREETRPPYILKVVGSDGSSAFSIAKSPRKK